MFQKSKLLLIGGISIILIALGFCGYKVHTLSIQQETIRKDYSAANNITFGLLSVSQWRNQLETVITQEIQNFNFTPEQSANLEKEIEVILNSLIDKAVASIEKHKKTLKGKLSKFAFNTFVDPKTLHEQVPAFAKQIITEVEKPSSKNRLRSVAQSKMKQLGEETYDSSRDQQLKVINTVYKKYHVNNPDDFDKKTNAMLNNIEHSTYAYASGMLACILVILIVWRVLRNKEELFHLLFMLSVIAALIILLVGLTTTMIEVDARIKSLNFYLLGSNITFRNQVLFFQSKSIVDVVKILIKTGRYDSVIVGILILCFSVIFPIGKLFSASVYLLGNSKWSKSKVIHYFAFKSGKWSMADVMVVGILMTYIGFNGILESQLAVLNIHDESLVSITTNNTALQPGYIVFVGFVVFGLILSQILKNITEKKQE